MEYSYIAYTEKIKYVVFIFSKLSNIVHYDIIAWGDASLITETAR